MTPQFHTKKTHTRKMIANILFDRRLIGNYVKGKFKGRPIR